MNMGLDTDFCFVFSVVGCLVSQLLFPLWVLGEWDGCAARLDIFCGPDSYGHWGFQVECVLGIVR